MSSLRLNWITTVRIGAGVRNAEFLLLSECTVDKYFHPGCGRFQRRPVHICLIRVIFCIWPLKSRVTLGSANPLTSLKARSTHDPTGSTVHTHSKILTTATHDTTSSCVQNSKILFHKEEIHSHQTHKKRLRSQHFRLHNGLLAKGAFSTLRYNWHHSSSCRSLLHRCMLNRNRLLPCATCTFW